MTTISQHLSDPELLATEWDLDPLVGGEGAQAVQRMLTEASQQASQFADSMAGRVADLDSEGLARAMHELDAINDLVGRAATYASLRFSTDTADPERGALLQRVEEGATEIQTKLLFFELEWAALEDQRADALLEADGLGFCRHYLRSARRYRPTCSRSRRSGFWPRSRSPRRARGPGCSASSWPRCGYRWPRRS